MCDVCRYGIGARPCTETRNDPPKGAGSPDILIGDLATALGAKLETSFPARYCARWNASCPRTRNGPAEAGPLAPPSPDALPSRFRPAPRHGGSWNEAPVGIAREHHMWLV